MLHGVALTETLFLQDTSFLKLFKRCKRIVPVLPRRKILKIALICAKWLKGDFRSASFSIGIEVFNDIL